MATTIGHSERFGGLRGHSVGPAYPFIVFAKGTPEDLRWHIMHVSGVMMTTQGHSRALEAHRAALLMKQCAYYQP